MIHKLLGKIIIKINRCFPDELYLKILYWCIFKTKLNLKEPKTFNEKLQWLKLHDRNINYCTLVDKFLVKEYVSNVLGNKYVIPTLAVYDSVKDIKLDELPEKFVLKTTHSGGNTGVVICTDKSTFDLKKAQIKLDKSLKKNSFYKSREWPYKKLKPKIICEKYIAANEGNDLFDYKFFCFDGEVKALFVATERSTGNVKFDFFDSDFNHLNIVQIHPMSNRALIKPNNFEEMKTIASKLSKGIPHVRVDLYNIDGQIYFGEMTFYHHGGFVAFHPEKWNHIFGSWLKL